MSGDELTNPPWAKGNLEDWLYRPVKVRGRPVHRHEMKFAVDRNHFKGISTYVPLVTKEDEECTLESREGLILGYGWFPKKQDHVSDRHRWETSWNAESYIGYVSTGQDLPYKGEGNVANEQMFDIRSFYLPEMGKATGFKNQGAVGLAVIERVNLDTPLDERDPRHYDIPLDAHTLWPYIKTRAGALQSPMMPWDYRNRQYHWGLAGIFTAALALACKVA